MKNRDRLTVNQLAKDYDSLFKESASIQYANKIFQQIEAFSNMSIDLEERFNHGEELNDNKFSHG